MIKLEPLYETLAFRDISDEVYFSNEYREYISNSKLGLINPDQGGSVEKYKQGFGKSSTDSLILGSAVHELVLQPEFFELNESVDRPTAKMGMMADELLKVFKRRKEVTSDEVIAASDSVDYYKGKMTPEKIEKVLNECTKYWTDRVLHDVKTEGRKDQIYLDPKSREKCKLCVKSIQDNEEIQKLLHPKGIFENPISMNEAALFVDFKATDTETGRSLILKFKAKLDNFTVDLENNELVLNDLKTTGHYLPKFRDSMDTYHYWRQMGAYAWLMKAWCMKDFNMKSVDSLRANMLVVSTIPEYKSGIFRVPKDKLIEGWREYIRLMKMVAQMYFDDGKNGYVL